jgi:hypothetical protein
MRSPRFGHFVPASARFVNRFQVRAMDIPIAIGHILLDVEEVLPSTGLRLNAADSSFKKNPPFSSL